MLTDVELLLGQRRRRWSNMNSTFCEFLLLAWKCPRGSIKLLAVSTEGSLLAGHGYLVVSQATPTIQTTTPPLLCKTERQYLLIWQVGIYCFLALQGGPTFTERHVSRWTPPQQ